MIRIFTLISLLFLLSDMQAQVCDLPNGDLEIWTDFTAEFDELTADSLAEGTIITPEGYISRLFDSDTKKSVTKMLIKQ